MHTSFIEFGVSTISAKVGLRVGSFCHHLCSNSTSIGCVSAAIVSLRSCMQRYRICQIRIRNRNSTTLSEEYFTFPPSTEKIQMSYNSTFAFYLEPFPFSKLKWYDNSKMCYYSFSTNHSNLCVKLRYLLNTGNCCLKRCHDFIWKLKQKRPTQQLAKPHSCSTITPMKQNDGERKLGW
jgi:hypothetical protein